MDQFEVPFFNLELCSIFCLLWILLTFSFLSSQFFVGGNWKCVSNPFHIGSIILFFLVLLSRSNSLSSLLLLEWDKRIYCKACF